MPPIEAFLIAAIPWLLLWRHLPGVGEAAWAALGAELPHGLCALLDSADPEGPGLEWPFAVPAWVSMPGKEGHVACRQPCWAVTPSPLEQQSPHPWSPALVPPAPHGTRSPWFSAAS